MVAKVFNILNERLYLFIGLLEKTYRTKHHINLPLLISSLPVSTKIIIIILKIHSFIVVHVHRCRSTHQKRTCHWLWLNGWMISQRVKKHHIPHAQYDEIKSRTASLIYPDKRPDMHFNPFSTCCWCSISTSVHTAYSEAIGKASIKLNQYVVVSGSH